MLNKKFPPIKKINVKDVADFLNTNYKGTNFEIETIATLDDIKERSIIFTTEKINEDILVSYKNICFVTTEYIENEYINGHSFIVVNNPRLALAKVLDKFFVEKKKSNIGTNTIIHPTAKIDKTVIIGENCFIGKNVEIGEGTEIRNNVVIGDNVKIGRHCLIRSNVVIGEEGFGFEFDDGIPIRIPHLGGVEIGDFVEIGNFTAIAKGTLKNTIIKSHVKIDNLVHIAHNCIIEDNTLVIACAEISGSVEIGKNCWIAPGCVTKQKIKIGDNALVGLGSVVISDVEKDTIVVGNPAKFLKYKK